MNCYRCGELVPEANLREAVAAEEEWRQWEKDHPLTGRRVLICVPCADELEELEGE